jgi:hypothetical protein
VASSCLVPAAALFQQCVAYLAYNSSKIDHFLLPLKLPYAVLQNGRVLMLDNAAIPEATTRSFEKVALVQFTMHRSSSSVSCMVPVCTPEVECVQAPRQPSEWPRPRRDHQCC